MSLGTAWVLFTAWLIWVHARESTQPPIYDAFTYYFKAKFVWADLLSGHITNLLNVEPSFRPPGTVLMSYPFGFDPDFRGFYFRSVFFPIALVFLSVLIAAWRPGSSSRYLRLAALTAVFLPTVSLFYYFEPYTGGPPVISHWGLVDSFLTGLAALATACGLRSISRQSVGWGIVSTLIGVVMIFVKPTGALIAAVSGSIVALGWLWNLKKAWPIKQVRRQVLRRFVALVLVQALFLGWAVRLATHSLYLGPVNMMYGNAAIDVMRAELKIDLSALLALLHSGLGPFIPVWTVGLSLLWIYSRLKERGRSAERWALDDILVVLAAVILIIGAWFWLVASGGQTQIRYFAPFLFVALICAICPFIESLARSARPIRWVVSLLMVGSVANTTLLLALPSPSLAWQLASGVNVMSGTRPPSIPQAQFVLAHAAANVDSVPVYSMTQSVGDAMFESTFGLYSLKASKPRFFVRRPIDWQRPSTFRVDEIVTSDYILFDPREPQATSGTMPTSVTDFSQEQAVFLDWANGLKTDDGVEIASAQANSTLLRVVDRTKLRDSLEKLVQSHQWRDLFLAGNTRKWWSEEQVEEALVHTPAQIESVDFADKFEVRAATIVQLPDNTTELRMWLRPTTKLNDDNWAVLVHLIDATGEAVGNRDLALETIDASPPGKPYSYVHIKFVPPKSTAKIAIGIYRGQTVLPADKGERDWGGKRVLLTLPGAGLR